MMRFSKIMPLFFVFTLYIFYNVNAQSPYFKTIQLLKSKQTISIKCIFQDFKGNLWLSTSQGLIRYDGVVAYTFGQKDSLGNSQVAAIGEDTSHHVWLGHKDGSIEFETNNYFKKFKPEEGLGHSEISFLKFDSNNILWFGTLGEGVYYFSGKNRKRIYNINSDDGLNDNYVYTIAIGNNKTKYIGTDNGINIINSKNKVVSYISMKNGLPDNIVKHLEINDDVLWIGMDEAGVCTYNINTKKFTFLTDWKFGTLNTFTLNSTIECWACTENKGIIKIIFKNNTLNIIKQYSNNNGLPGDDAQVIFSDREKNIWIGYSKNLVLYASSPFEIIDKKSDGFNYRSVFCFITDSKGRYWAATQNGLICIHKDSKGQLIHTRFLAKNKDIQNAFISLYCDNKGFVWAGTYGYGVFRINPDNLNFTKFNIQNGLPDNNILYITGKDDSVWLATAGGGASLYNLKSKIFKNYNATSGLGSNYLYSIFIDSNNYVWFSLDGMGTSVLKNGKLYTHILPDSLNINTIYSITEDKSGTMWFLTANKGLLCYNNLQFNFYNENNGLISNNIRSIISDKTGNLVIASNEGIQIFNPNAKGFETYREDRGVANLEPNLNGISEDSEGNIWISESKGIVKYKPFYFKQLNIQPKVSINKILLFFNPIDLKNSNFNYKQNHFIFEYSGIWFQSVENLIYRYKLKNYDFD
jgi:ligand-binding sensor domain-containing protein